MSELWQTFWILLPKNMESNKRALYNLKIETHVERFQFQTINVHQSLACYMHLQYAQKLKCL